MARRKKTARKVASGGRETPIDQAQIAAAANRNGNPSAGIQTGGGEDWFGPLNPTRPVAPKEVASRQLDFPSGYNLNLYPRAYEPIGFPELRALADAYDLIRLLIETRKDQMERLTWSIKPRADGDGQPVDDGKFDAKIAEIKAFFRKPDKVHNWSIWLRMLIEDLLVIDAATVYRQRARNGSLYALLPIDGATIKRVIDDYGRTPVPPSPAYQQVLKGMPAVDYTSEDLLYAPRNVRTNRVYGYSPVEQVVMTINIALRKQVTVLQHFTEGNIPDAMIGVPETWNPDQISDFQKWFDSLMAGNTASRRRATFVPGGMTPTFTRDPELKSAIDEWLARVVCFCFSISPQPFVAQMNRATAQTAHEQSIAEGLFPIQNWVKNLIDDVIATDFKAPELEFTWDDDREVDPSTAAVIRQGDVKAGILAINEARDDLGKDPTPGGDKPMVLTANGYVPIDPADIEPAPVPGQAIDPNAQPKPGEPKPADAKSGQKEEAGKFAGAPFVKAARHLPPVRNTRPAVTKATRKLARKLAPLLKAQGKHIAQQVVHNLGDLLKAAADDGRVNTALDNLDFSTWAVMIDPTEEALGAIGADASKKALATVGINDTGITDQVHQDALDYAEVRAAELVGKTYDGDLLIDNPNAEWSITESTRDMLRSTVTQAVQEGWSSDRLAAAIEDGDAFSADRAATIARTELAFANSRGAMEGYRASGVVEKKVWLLGEEACDECQGNADAGEIPLDDAFPSGDDAPPAHPRCVCDCAPIVSEAGADDDSEE